MRTFLAGVIALSLAAPLAAGDPLAEAAVAVCLAKLRAAQTVPTRVERVSFDGGLTWVTRTVPVVDSPPLFATPARGAAYQLFPPAASPCANGQCPTPARSTRR